MKKIVILAFDSPEFWEGLSSCGVLAVGVPALLILLLVLSAITKRDSVFWMCSIPVVAMAAACVINLNLTLLARLVAMLLLVLPLASRLGRKKRQSR